MSKQIVEEVTTRECCHPQDLAPYKGPPIERDFGRSYFDNSEFSVCEHCGQMFRKARRTEGGWDWIKDMGIRQGT